MSDPKEATGSKGGFGVFIKAKTKASPAAAPGVTKPKDVKRRWMYIGGGLAVVLMAVSTMMKKEEPPRIEKVKKEEPVIDVTPKDESKKAFEARFGYDLEDMKRRMQQLEMDNQSKAVELKELKERANAKQPAAKDSGAMDNSGGLGPVASGTVPAPPQPPKPRTEPAAPTTPSLPPGLTMPPNVSNGSAPSTLPPPLLPQVQEKKPQIYEAPALSTSEKPDVEAKVTYTKNPNAGAFSLGFAPVALLNGLDAGTSQTTQSNPMPVLMDVRDHLTLPGLDRYQMKNCFLLGSGYGELSAERVYIRVSRISCVDKANKLSVTAEVNGVVNDSDGKLGLRGVITDRQGARLAKAVLAGFAQGLTQALAQGQATTTSSSLTGTTTSALQGGAVARAAGLTGAQTAANQLAEFYLKEAQSIFPVISVDAGRIATVMFTGSTKLQWQSTEGQYVQTVTPTGK